jgi:hypothetical protein
MSHTITIDTHFHAKNLKKVGFNDDQVDAQLALAQSQTDFINNNLATKQDIRLLELKIDASKQQTKLFGSLILAGLTILGFLISFHH